MIVIEPVILPERGRYPRPYIIPIVVPPSPPGNRGPERKSSLWGFGLLAALVAGVVLPGSKSPGRLGGAAAPRKKSPGNKLLYMWIPPGKWFDEAISIPKSQLNKYHQIAIATKNDRKPGRLFYIWSTDAGYARWQLTQDASTRHKWKPTWEQPKRPPAGKPESQLTLFGGKGCRDKKGIFIPIPRCINRPSALLKQDIPEEHAGLEVFKSKKKAKGAKPTMGQTYNIDIEQALVEVIDLKPRTKYFLIPLSPKRTLITSVEPEKSKGYLTIDRHGLISSYDLNNRLRMQKTAAHLLEPKETRATARLKQDIPRELIDPKLDEYLRGLKPGQKPAIGAATKHIFGQSGKQYKEALLGWLRKHGFKHWSDFSVTMERQRRTGPIPADYLKGLSGTLSGDVANCAIWIPDGSGGYKCGGYARVCEPPTCETPTDTKKKQIKVCTKTQSVYSPFYNREIERCKKYKAACRGAACMTEPMPYPDTPSERTEPDDSEVESVARWMAEEYNRETFEKEPLLARGIMARGGIRSYRKGVEKAEYKGIPLFLKNREGLPLDEMAAEMKYDTSRDLVEAIVAEYPIKAKGSWKKLQRKTWEEFKNTAFEMIDQGMEAGTWSGLAGAPASVWQSTLREFTALPRKDDDPALPASLNWILKKAKMNEEGILRVFRGNLPGHMTKQLRDWLWDRHRDPATWLTDKRLKIGFRDSTYTVNHPYYNLMVRFYKNGSVLVTEDRGMYHGTSVEKAIKEGKKVPRKVLENYAPYIPEAKRALDLGQDLFPGLRRELVLEPPQDTATSDDPVTACMERQGWRIPRIEELKASISEKLTPDLFTSKTTKLSAGEKEYQRVVQECLQTRSGTAGLSGKRVKYFKGDANSAINAALKTVDDTPLYIFPTAYGYAIETYAPPWLNHYMVHPDGTVESHMRDVRTGKWTVEALKQSGTKPPKRTEPEQLTFLGGGTAYRGHWFFIKKGGRKVEQIEAPLDSEEFQKYLKAETLGTGKTYLVFGRGAAAARKKVADTVKRVNTIRRKYGRGYVQDQPIREDLTGMHQGQAFWIIPVDDAQAFRKLTAGNTVKDLVYASISGERVATAPYISKDREIQLKIEQARLLSTRGAKQQSKRGPVKFVPALYPGQIPLFREPEQLKLLGAIENMTPKEAEKERSILNKKAIENLKKAAAISPGLKYDVPKPGRTLSHDIATHYLTRDEMARYKSLTRVIAISYMSPEKVKRIMHDPVLYPGQRPPVLYPGQRPLFREPEQLKLLGRTR